VASRLDNPDPSPDGYGKLEMDMEMEWINKQSQLL